MSDDWPRRRYEALGRVLRAVEGLTRDEKHNVLRAAACLDGIGEEEPPELSARERIMAALRGAGTLTTVQVLTTARASQPHGYRILRALAAEGLVVRGSAGSKATWLWVSALASLPAPGEG